MSSALRRGKKANKEEPKEGIIEEAEKEVKKVEKVAAKAAKMVEKAVERKAKDRHKVQPPKPLGRVPEATVLARHGTGMVGRLGRGFSLGELSGGGLAPGLASKWGVRVDTRRRSVLEGNVNSLKVWHSGAGAKARVEHEVKEVKEELKEVGEEVEREVVAVEKEAARAGRAIKKKAEKAVEKRVEKPRARPKKKEKP